MTKTGRAQGRLKLWSRATRRKVVRSAGAATASGAMVEPHVRTASREPLEHAIREYVARRQDEEMALVDRGAEPKTITGASNGWRGLESPVAAAVAGTVAVIVVLLTLVALAMRVVG